MIAKQNLLGLLMLTGFMSVIAVEGEGNDTSQDTHTRLVQSLDSVHAKCPNCQKYSEKVQSILRDECGCNLYCFILGFIVATALNMCAWSQIA